MALGAPRAPAREPCSAWGEARAAGGWSVAVRCAPPGAEASLRGPARRLFGLGLDPNRADAGSLETLPGIGPARARAWLAERARGPFRRPRDLERIPGIGPVLRARVTPHLHFPGSLESRGP